MIKRTRNLLAVSVAAALLLAGGCLTARQKAQLFRQPTNRMFEVGRLAPLGPEETHRLSVYDQAGGQNACVLQLARDAMLKKRYHKEHDATLIAVSGSAIVVVEETRYFLTPGAGIFLPRYTAYSILPHEAEGEFVALMVYSPPFEGKDVVLED